MDTVNQIIGGRVTSRSPFTLVEPTGVSFASFAARVEIEKKECEVKGTLDVTLQVGAFATTIPAGSFRRHGHGT